MPDVPEAPDVALAAATRSDAVQAISVAARGRQLVILNEAHHSPEHRAFALEVARALYRQGFRWFAAEDFAPKPDLSTLRDRGYAVRTDGFYLREPVFGDLVRQVVRLGYQPVAYEMAKAPPDPSVSVEDRIRRREEAEASALVERVFQVDPEARVFVYCGYSHVAEDMSVGEDGRELGWMAALLQRRTGIDPLTIDQTDQGPSASRTSADWEYAQSHGWLQGPVVLWNADGSGYVGGDYRGRVDLQVFHPPTVLRAGRPGWLAMHGYRRPTPIPAAALPTTGSVLVQAFVEGEQGDTIPMDQAVVRAGAAPPVLMLPRGRYRIEVQDPHGAEVLHTTELVRVR